MERAPLRPVPSRPAGPIAPAEAVRYVTGELPGLDEGATAALALVALVGWSRHEVAGSPESQLADPSGGALADALARARKALRRKLHPLPGSGWCERAEGLISDRLDDALVDPGPARLEVHLANCARCVEHERRLGQAHEALVAGFEATHSAEGEPEGQRPPPSSADQPPSLPVLRAVATPALPAPATTGEQHVGAPEPPPEALERETGPPEALPEGEETPQIEEPAAAEALPEGEESPQIAEPEAAEALPAAGATRQIEASPVAAAVPGAPPSGAPPASPWSTQPPSPWATQASPPPAAWRASSPRPALAARAALETESEWGAIGALVAVLGVAVVLGLLAFLLAAGG